jgi:hypothetical protein
MGHKFERIKVSSAAFRSENMQRKGSRRTKYLAEGELMIGDTLKKAGQWPTTPEWIWLFIKIPDPRKRAISYDDFKALNNALFNFTLLRYGVVNTDKTYLEELVRQNKERLPYPPVVKATGAVRDYHLGLYYRFANGRSHSNKEVCNVLRLVPELLVPCSHPLLSHLAVGSTPPHQREFEDCQDR